MERQSCISIIFGLTFLLLIHAITGLLIDVNRLEKKAEEITSPLEGTIVTASVYPVAGVAPERSLIDTSVLTENRKELDGIEHLTSIDEECVADDWRINVLIVDSIYGDYKGCKDDIVMHDYLLSVYSQLVLVYKSTFLGYANYNDIQIEDCNSCDLVFGFSLKTFSSTYLSSLRTCYTDERKIAPFERVQTCYTEFLKSVAIRGRAGGEKTRNIVITFVTAEVLLDTDSDDGTLASCPFITLNEVANNLRKEGVYWLAIVDKKNIETWKTWFVENNVLGSVILLNYWNMQNVLTDVKQFANSITCAPRHNPDHEYTGTVPSEGPEDEDLEEGDKTQPTTDETTTEATTVEVTTESTAVERSAEPATTEPATTEPATTEPATTEPATTEPAETEPVITEVSTEPGTTSTVTATTGRDVTHNGAQKIDRTKTVVSDTSNRKKKSCPCPVGRAPCCKLNPAR